jgi:uncharacterized membrane protein YeaQ/YmgE (transglycosylase-associated protein family)
MSLVDFLILLIVAGVCGMIGQTISGYSRGGCLVAIALGFIGSLIGVWLKRTLALPELLMLNIGNSQFPVVWSVLGAALFVAVIGFLSRQNRRPMG